MMRKALVGVVLFLASASLANADAEMLDVLGAKVKFDPGDGSYGIVLRFSNASSEILKRLTTAHVGRVLAIELDGKAVWLPTIREPITNGFIFLSNLDSQELAERMASEIWEAGKIGVEVQIPPGG